MDQVEHYDPSIVLLQGGCCWQIRTDRNIKIIPSLEHGGWNYLQGHTHQARQQPWMASPPSHKPFRRRGRQDEPIRKGDKEEVWGLRFQKDGLPQIPEGGVTQATASRVSCLPAKEALMVSQIHRKEKENPRFRWGFGQNRYLRGYHRHRARLIWKEQWLFL